MGRLAGRAMSTSFKRGVLPGLPKPMAEALREESGTYPRIIVYLHKDTTESKQYFRSNFRAARKKLGLVVMNDEKPVEVCGQYIAFDITGTPDALQDFTSPYKWPCFSHWHFALSVAIPRGGNGQSTTDDAERAKARRRAAWRADGALVCKDSEQARKFADWEKEQARKQAQEQARARVWDYWRSITQGIDGEGI